MQLVWCVYYNWMQAVSNIFLFSQADALARSAHSILNCEYLDSRTSSHLKLIHYLAQMEYRAINIILGSKFITWFGL